MCLYFLKEKNSIQLTTNNIEYEDYNTLHSLQTMAINIQILSWFIYNNLNILDPYYQNVINIID
jgi:hypothetical protein